MNRSVFFSCTGIAVGLLVHLAWGESSCTDQQIQQLRKQGYSPEIIRDHCYGPPAIPPIPGEGMFNPHRRVLPPLQPPQPPAIGGVDPKAVDEKHKKFTDYIRGTTRVVNPETGQETEQWSHASYWYQHRYSGQIVGSEDPSLEATGDWVRLQVK